MSKIKVHLLNFHGLFNSHIEIVLENTSINPPVYFHINRWGKSILSDWEPDINEVFTQKINSASSKYSFMIEANPYTILDRWAEYWNGTRETASVLKTNCAVAAQWFLTEFARIPKPNLSNISLNYLTLGIPWPSFIPCPVMLPGRVLSNAKFHIEIRDHPKLAQQYSDLYLHVAMAATALTVAASALGIYVALTMLTGGLAAVAIAGCVVLGLANFYGFFSAYNRRSAKRLTEAKSEEKNSYGNCYSVI